MEYLHVLTEIWTQKKILIVLFLFQIYFQFWLLAPYVDSNKAWVGDASTPCPPRTWDHSNLELAWIYCSLQISRNSSERHFSYWFHFSCTPAQGSHLIIDCETSKQIFKIHCTIRIFRSNSSISSSIPLFLVCKSY